KIINKISLVLALDECTSTGCCVKPDGIFAVTQRCILLLGFPLAICAHQGNSSPHGSPPPRPLPTRQHRHRTSTARRPPPLRLATLNVGSLTGRGGELARMLKARRADICCIQETRWSGNSARPLGDGYKLLHTGTGKRNGVGIVVSRRIAPLVTRVHHVSCRLMAVELDGKDLRCLVVSAYAPQ